MLCVASKELWRCQLWADCRGWLRDQTAASFSRIQCWQPCCLLTGVEKGFVQRKRILIADDELGVREAIKLLLSIDEHTVTEAETGVAALALFQQESFDLVITDLEMPRMRGDELAARIKELSPAQPIIMITAYSEKLQGSGNPVDALLHKPFRFDELRQTMTSVLASARTRA